VYPHQPEFKGLGRSGANRAARIALVLLNFLKAGPGEPLHLLFGATTRTDTLLSREEIRSRRPVSFAPAHHFGAGKSGFFSLSLFLVFFSAFANDHIMEGDPGSEKVSLLSSEAGQKAQGGGKRWTCELCAQTRNTEDMDTCKTCNRPRGHKPDKYFQRLNELHQMDPSFDDNYFQNEESSWSDYWGLILGLILLAVILAVLSWAIYEDSKETVDKDGTEL